jgi:hypothetical protein
MSQESSTDIKPCTLRRWTVLGLLASLLPQWAYSQHKKTSADTVNSQHSADDAALKQRFRDIGGGEKRIDAIDDLRPVALFFPNGDLFQKLSGPGRHASTSSYGGDGKADSLPIPRTLRMIRYAEGSVPFGNSKPFSAYDGTVVTDVTVPVASRIPDNVLDRVRQSKGGLRLKLRLHPQTLLVAWEVSLGQGWRFRRDFAGNAYTTDEDTLPGGDFREARVRFELLRTGGERKIFEKGWYIDPITGQKIETDF